MEKLGQFMTPPIPMWEVTVGEEGPIFTNVVLIEVVPYDFRSSVTAAVYREARYITEQDIGRGHWRFREIIDDAHSFFLAEEKAPRRIEYLAKLGHHEDVLGTAFLTCDDPKWIHLYEARMEEQWEAEQKRVRAREKRTAKRAQLKAV